MQTKSLQLLDHRKSFYIFEFIWREQAWFEQKQATLIFGIWDNKHSGMCNVQCTVYTNQILLHLTTFQSAPFSPRSTLSWFTRVLFIKVCGKGREQWSSKESHLSQISSFSDRRRRIILATDCQDQNGNQCWVLYRIGGCPSAPCLWKLHLKEALRGKG